MKETDAGNRGQEKDADWVEDLVRTGKLKPSVELQDPIPMFALCKDLFQSPLPISLKLVLERWETDPDNTDGDRKFVAQLRRTDLLPGSFFILIIPWLGSKRSYLWRLCRPSAVRQQSTKRKEG